MVKSWVPKYGTCREAGNVTMYCRFRPVPQRRYMSRCCAYTSVPSGTLRNQDVVLDVMATAIHIVKICKAVGHFGD